MLPRPSLSLSLSVGLQNFLNFYRIELVDIPIVFLLLRYQAADDVLQSTGSVQAGNERHHRGNHQGWGARTGRDDFRGHGPPRRGGEEAAGGWEW